MQRLGLALGCLAVAASAAPAVSYTLIGLESTSALPSLSPAPVLMPRSALACDPLPLSGSGSASAERDGWRIQHTSFVHRVQHEPLPGSEVPASSWLFRGGSVTDDNFRRDGLGAAAAYDHGSVQPANFQSRFLHRQLLANLRAVAAKILETNSSESGSGFPASDAGSESIGAFPANDSDIYLIDINLMWPERDEDSSRITAEYRWFAEHAGSDPHAERFQHPTGVKYDGSGPHAKEFLLPADIFAERDGEGDPNADRFQLPAGEFHSWPVFGTANNISMEYEDEPPAHAEARRRYGAEPRRVSRNAELREALLSGHAPRGYEAPDHLRQRLDRIESMLMHKHREVYERDLRSYEQWIQMRQKHSDSDSKSELESASLRARLPPPPSKRTIVVYVHCFCGTDRTGEMMGSWALSRQARSFPQVTRRNAKIGGRPMACRNYRALQLWCLEVQGQRPEWQLECEENQPCTEFV